MQMTTAAVLYVPVTNWQITFIGKYKHAVYSKTNLSSVSSQQANHVTSYSFLLVNIEHWYLGKWTSQPDQVILVGLALLSLKIHMLVH